MRISIFNYFILFFVIGIFLLSCTETEKKTASRIDSLASLPIPLDTANSYVVKMDAAVNDTTTFSSVIKGTVFYSLPYCGGARPSDEMLAQLAQQKSLTKSTLKLKNNPEASGREFLITTDNKGNFSTTIPYGTYDVYLTKETNPTIYSVSPDACEDCLTKPITSVKIKEGKKVRIEFKFRCDPGAKLRP